MVRCSDERKFELAWWPAHLAHRADPQGRVSEKWIWFSAADNTLSPGLCRSDPLSRAVFQAPGRWRLPRPAAEGPREGARLGISECRGNLAEGDSGVAQQLARDLEPRLVDQALETGTFSPQVPAQGAAMDGKAIRDRRGRAAVRQDLGS